MLMEAAGVWRFWNPNFYRTLKFINVVALRDFRHGQDPLLYLALYKCQRDVPCSKAFTTQVIF